MFLRNLKRITPKSRQQYFNTCAQFHKQRNVQIHPDWIQLVLGGGANLTFEQHLEKLDSISDPTEKKEEKQLIFQKFCNAKSKKIKQKTQKKTNSKADTSKENDEDLDENFVELVESSKENDEDLDENFVEHAGFQASNQKQLVKQDNNILHIYDRETTNKLRFKIHGIQGDGFCFYNAVIAGLKRKKLFQKLDTRNVNCKKMSGNLKDICPLIEGIRSVKNDEYVQLKLKHNSKLDLKTIFNVLNEDSEFLNQQMWGGTELLDIIAYIFPGVYFICVSDNSHSFWYYSESKKKLIESPNQFPKSFTKSSQYVAIYNKSHFHFDNLELIDE